MFSKSIRVLLILLLPATVHANVVGQVLLVKGVATANSASTAARSLAKGSDVFLGETINTAKDSFIVLKMADNSKISLRPESQVVLEKFSQVSGEEEALFDLVKGGLRALSGSIGKKRPEMYQVDTSIATIGIRGTDFYVRLCLTECKDEEERFSNLQKQNAGPIGGAGSTKRKELRRLNQDNSVSSKSFLECKPAAELKKGLYVAVFDGKIWVRKGNEEVDLEAVEAIFAEEKEILCMGQIPNFIMRDGYLQKNAETSYELYNVLQNITEDQPFCAIPEA